MSCHAQWIVQLYGIEGNSPYALLVFGAKPAEPFAPVGHEVEFVGLCSPLLSALEVPKILLLHVGHNGPDFGSIHLWLCR